MYLAVDIGGTKTLIAAFSDDGTKAKSYKFPTSQDYSKFLDDLSQHLPVLEVQEYTSACVAIPGQVDREHGRGLWFGNLPWQNVPIQADVERLVNAPVVIENDAKVGGLSEAKLISNEFSRVLYLTLGTGIGTAIINNGVIDTNFSDLGGRVIRVEKNGNLVGWETLSSGKSIVAHFGKQAEDIHDNESWATIARDLSLGLINLIAILQPDAVVIGGGVGLFFERFKDPLVAELKKYQTPLSPVPPILQAKRPDEAVIYGCYILANQKYASAFK